MTKTRKIAELAFHKETCETEAIAAFLALRRCGFSELKNILGEGESNKEQISSWKISGPDSYIGLVTYTGCSLAEQMDGKCHIRKNKKEIFGKQKYTITLKYSSEYSSIAVEEQFEKLLKR